MTRSSMVATAFRLHPGKGTGKCRLQVSCEGDSKIPEPGQTLTYNGELGKTMALNYPFKLVADKTYVFDMTTDSKTLDPYLRLLGADGKELAHDDDGGGGLNARLVFQAPKTGHYQIIATCLKNGRGPFVLTARATAPGEKMTPVANKIDLHAPLPDDPRQLLNQLSMLTGNAERLWSTRNFSESLQSCKAAVLRVNALEGKLTDRRPLVELAGCCKAIGALYSSASQHANALQLLLKAESIYDDLIARGMIGNEKYPEAKANGYTNAHHLECLDHIARLLRDRRDETSYALLRESG